MKKQKSRRFENNPPPESLFEYLPDAMLVSDTQGRIVRMNAQAEALFGYSRKELLGRSIDSLVPAGRVESHARHRAGYHAAPQIRPMGLGKDLHARRKDGSKVPVDISLSHVTQGGELLVIAVVRDLREHKRLETALRESQRTLSTLMSNLPGMAYRCKPDPDWTLEFTSDGCFDLTGYTAADFIQNRVISFGELIHRDDREKGWEDVESAIREKRPFQLTYRIVTATGDEKWVWEQGSGIFSADGNLEAIEGFITDITARKQAADERDRYAQRLQSLSHELLQTQETERRHIALELHDQIGQLLTGLKFNMETIRQENTDSPRSSLAGALDLIDDLTTRVRSLSLDLRPPMLHNLGLLPTLQWHFERYTRQTKVRVRFHRDGLDRRLPPDVEITAYRIVQEALTNVARYASVDEVAVHCTVSGSSLIIKVEDHGKGFDSAAKLHSHATCGLTGMSERATLLSGRLTVESKPGAGTSVTAEIPLPE